jgi:hypothetical protein
MEFRYKVYGIKPAEHNDTNDDTKPNDQTLTGVIEVYETNDREEAKSLVKEGGFVSPTLGYVAIQGAKDTVNGGTIGVVPSGV